MNQTIEQAAMDAAEGVVKGALASYLRFPPWAVDFAWKSLMAIGELVASEFTGGGGDAQRKAMMDQADAAVDAAEREKFGS